MPPETQNNNANEENSENQNLNLSTTQNSNHNKKNVLIFAFIFVLVIIGIYFSYRFLNTQMFSYPNQEAPQVIQEKDEMLNWKTYQNEKYGFEFKYPSSHTVYKSIDEQKEILIHAEPYDDFVAITENENAIFCCEPITLIFRIIKVSSSSTWLSEDIMNGGYLSLLENIERKETMFVGKPAVIFTGSDNLGSAYRMYFIILDDQNILLIQQGSKSDFLDTILSTFKFISTSTPVQ